MAYPVDMNVLEREREKIIAVPAINGLVITIYEAEAFRHTHETAEKTGYKWELDGTRVTIEELLSHQKRGHCADLVQI